ncbi:MAG TPA: hypothetical protein VNA20_06600 [Frankiaceae bacterium]|nr:hypothetical protein [Frankiaceae bacterium]
MPIAGAAGTESGPAVADCPVGKVVYGGGAKIDTSAGSAAINDSYPSDNNTWTAVGVVVTGPAAGTVTAYAVCGNP